MNQLTPIYHFTHITNLERIVRSNGLWACNLLRGAGIDYLDIAHQNLQAQRALVRVRCHPGGTLHDYVPFYFAPRSPMMFAISKGNVESYPEGQEPLVYLVSSVEAVVNSGRRFV